jgi:hypothetical protein
MQGNPPGHIRAALLRMIERDKYAARREYHDTAKWWNPERAAFYDKANKRFSRLYEMGSKIPEEGKPVELGALFCAFGAYRECIYSNHWKDPANERECYEKHLVAYFKEHV